MTASIDGLPEVRRALLAWHRRHGMRAPWRESGDPYQALVAATMGQQTQMSRVIERYERFIARYPTLEALAAASAGDVIRAWRGMGYNRRAVALHRAARRIAAEGWPRDAAGLSRIDGIGPFTAAIVSSFAFGSPDACIDTNVRRVLTRLAGDPAMRPAALRALAGAALARRSPARWNQALMDYGARVCTARPQCAACCVARWCRSAGAVDPPSRARGAARSQEPYHGSVRYYRGRIVDALRTLPRGRSVAVAELARKAGCGRRQAAALVAALERDGLARTTRRNGEMRASLPQ